MGFGFFWFGGFGVLKVKGLGVRLLHRAYGFKGGRGVKDWGFKCGGSRKTPPYFLLVPGGIPGPLMWFLTLFLI